MTRTLFAVVTAALMAMLVLSAGCAKRTYYVNAFGEYSLSDADAQYQELFQMKPCQYRQFLSFKDGWWRVDVVKMKEMGITVPDLCQRYCRTTNIKVPFPVLVDYSLLRDSA
jgi:hypothetical protein